jgi:hypothetical protein
MRRIALLVALAAALLALTPTGPASAHTASTYYPKHWPSNINIEYGLNAGFPGGTWPDRAYDSKQGWNNAAGTNEPEILWTLADGVLYGDPVKPCSLLSANNTAIVFYTDLDPIGTGLVGLTARCAPSTTILKASLTIDATGRTWYAGTGSAPAGSYDLWSAFAHEWGHVTGWSPHLTTGEASTCPSPTETVVRHVMCPSIATGTTVMRTLKTHDVHTFQGAY